MTVSHLTRSRNQLWSDLVGELGGSGSYLTLSEEELIAAAVNTYGGSVSAKTTGRADLIASLVNAAGGSVSSATHSEEEMMAALANALGGSVSALTGSFNSSLAASVNAAASEGGGGEYTANAVTFAGASGLRAQASVADAPCGLLSVWLKSSFGSGSFAMVNPGYTVQSDISTGGFLQTAVSDTGGDNYLDFEADTLDVPADVWFNLAYAWDTNHTTDARIGQVLINGVLSQGTTNQFGDDAYNVAVGVLSFFGDPEASMGFFLTADVADFQCWIGGTFRDMTNPTNVAKFIADGKPVDPATAAAAFGTPTFLFTGNAAAFVANQGSGPAVALVGDALTNAASSPSD